MQICKILFLIAIFPITSLKAISVWDMTPDAVRDYINEGIMKVEADTPSVGSVLDQTIQNENRTTSIRIYTPNTEDLLPVILLIHGGAWVAGNLDTHDNMARYLCNKTQALVVSVGYLNAPEGKFPLALEQSYDAMQWILEHASAFHADATKLAVVGDSAGGNMAAALCIMVRDRSGPKIDLQVLINPAPDLSGNGTIEFQGDDLDVMRWQAVQYVTHPAEANHPYVSPLLAEDLSNLPSALVVLAEKDLLYGVGFKFAERLQSFDIPTSVYCQKGIGHLAGNGARASIVAQESLDVAVDAMKTVFSNSKAPN
jgi:acetyl esterase